MKSMKLKNKNLKNDHTLDNKQINEYIPLDGPPCPNCGTIMQQTGHCYTCPECGENSGCG